jgi:hypothetical protein
MQGAQFCKQKVERMLAETHADVVANIETLSMAEEFFVAEKLPPLQPLANCDWHVPDIGRSTYGPLPTENPSTRTGHHFYSGARSKHLRARYATVQTAR